MHLYLLNNVNDFLALSLISHLNNDLLNDMISIKVKGAFLDSIAIKKFLHHSLLLGNLKHFEASLNNSAPVLVG